MSTTDRPPKDAIERAADELAEVFAREQTEDDAIVIEQENYADESFVAHVPTQREIDANWERWKAALLVDGRFSLEKLKRELYDVQFLIDNARRVYHHVTAGKCELLTASSEGIIAAAEHYTAERIQVAVDKVLTDLRAQNEI